jgi:hypothetical protein
MDLSSLFQNLSIQDIPFKIQFIQDFDIHFVIHYIPHDRDAWCEPISEYHARLLSTSLSMTISELSPFDRD